MAESENKTCQRCKRDFPVKPEDFDFYKKIEVPPPTWCPDCRMRRRFTWRNERTLHRNTCAATGKSVISCFAPGSGVVVYDRDYWWSDSWDPLAFGTEYDFQKPFFSQFRDLMSRAPMPAVFNARTTNCAYANHVGEIKDGYLASASFYGENIAYANICAKGRDAFDVYAVSNCTMVYEDVSSENLYSTHFSDSAENCSDSWFLYDCKGCTNCFGCTNLRNKSYYFWNEPCSREEYLKRLEEADLGSYRGLAAAKQKFEGLKRAALRKYGNILNSKNVTGDNIFNAANCEECFNVTGGLQYCKFMANTHLNTKDAYDGYGAGEHAELIYEGIDVGLQASRLLFDVVVWSGQDVRYSINCHGCSNCFGCIGLRNKQYCILNRQYTKEEYEALLPRIVEHMGTMPYLDAAGRRYGYGEFFPMELAPYAYNETIAQDYFPTSKEEAAAEGLRWHEQPPAGYTATMQAADLPDRIGDVADDILNAIIACGECGKVYRIIRQELDFLRRLKIPLPRACPECRHRARFRQVNLPKLYHRRCMCLAPESAYANTAQHYHGSDPCLNEFETSYAPGRPEAIYCEQCYNAEII